MNKREIAELLVLISGFDRFQPTDPVVVEAWALLPDLQNASFDDARSMVVRHFAEGGKGLVAGELGLALRSTNRNAKDQIAADVRSARARGLVESSWLESEPLTPGVAAALKALRDAERERARRDPDAWMQPRAVES